MTGLREHFRPDVRGQAGASLRAEQLAGLRGALTCEENEWLLELYRE